MNKHKNFLQRYPKLLIAAVLSMIVLASVQAVVDIHLLRAYKPDNSTLTQLIISSVEGLYKPVPVNPMNGAMYIPEARLVFPADESYAGQLRYNYNRTGDNDFELSITTAGLLRQGEARLLTAADQPGGSARGGNLALFKVVPNLQACARGVQLYPQSQKIEPPLRSAATLHLQDGRTLYGYTDTGCKLDTTALVNAVKQAKSY